MMLRTHPAPGSLIPSPDPRPATPLNRRPGIRDVSVTLDNAPVAPRPCFLDHVPVS
jgi:hypothetical protein